MQSLVEMRAHLGRRVTVVLNEDASDDPRVRVTGILRRLDDDGECHVETDEGMMYCWPALRVECND